MSASLFQLVSREATAVYYYYDFNEMSAIGLLVMMYPILCKVKYETLHLAFKTKELWIQIGFSVIMNWIVAPFLMVRTAFPSVGSRLKI